ncbi:tsp1 domain-containing protein tsp12 related [Cystoisospora suis]|uniref:Tsp1 domain-containing protein tsp12 related n=1 Tax=Cystoisospora suis TaxID=483139 RepID=A0A2C6L7T3_9APIC|nr:tsp1 domain-containing protein tsp12 related [Cystoisospora suis]
MAQALSQRSLFQEFSGPHFGRNHRNWISYRCRLHKETFLCIVLFGLWINVFSSRRDSSECQTGCMSNLFCGGSTLSEAVRVRLHGVDEQDTQMGRFEPEGLAWTEGQPRQVGFRHHHGHAISGQEVYDSDGWGDEELVEKRLLDDLGVGTEDSKRSVKDVAGPRSITSGALAVTSFFEAGTEHSDARGTVLATASESALPHPQEPKALHLEQLERLVQQLRVAGEPADQHVIINFEPNPLTENSSSPWQEAPSVTVGEHPHHAPETHAIHRGAQERPNISLAQLKEGQTPADLTVTEDDSSDGSSEESNDQIGEASVNQDVASRPKERDFADPAGDSSISELHPAEELDSAGKQTGGQATPDTDEAASGAEVKGDTSDRSANEEDTSGDAHRPVSGTSVDATGSPLGTGDATQAYESVLGKEIASRAEGPAGEQTAAAASFSARVLERLRRSSNGVASVLQVVEHGRLLNELSLVTIAYHFSFHTRESRRIAFIIVALPPGYTAPDQGPLCESVDPEMPPLSCQLRFVSPGKPAKDTSEEAQLKNVFIQVSSADKNRSLPLGMHHFGIAVHTPAHPIAVNVPSNWWFVTFRFTGGHAVTKHFENRLLTARQKCSWSAWRQETPCSATCGEGLEVWTRTLFAGESEDICGGAILKRKCFRAPCSVNCQLGPWQTVVDCTRSCDADNRRGFKISMRKVLMDKTGWGAACRHQYSWNPEAKEGWSEKLEAVIRLEPCEPKFAGSCPADVGCRAERINSRTLSVSYPWGSCPFPCGGLGSITSIVQVANGIPRWIGERDFPESFQAPCRADKEPLVTRTPCNTFDCEDCSVYLENATHGNQSRAWIFFLPTQDANIIKITAPRGVSFSLPPPPAADESSAPPLTTRSGGAGAAPTEGHKDEPGKDMSVAKGLLPHAEHPTEEDLLIGLAGRPEKKQQLAELTKKLDGDGGEVQQERKKSFQKLFEENACALMPASFGYVSTCSVGQSERYPGAEEATLRLAELIAPRTDDALNQSVYPHLQKTTSSIEARGGVKRRRRPEWLAVPITLGQASAMEDPGNFYLWLMSSWSPRDPEVFKCHMKTKLTVPKSCLLEYSAVDPKDCTDCRVDAPRKIMSLRTFVYAKHGGTCSIPIEQQISRPVIVYAACNKACGHIPHGETAMPSAMEKGGFTSLSEGEKLQTSSRLRNISRTGLKHLLEKVGGPHVSEPSALERGGRFSVDLEQVADYEDVVGASGQVSKGPDGVDKKERAKDSTGRRQASMAGENSAVAASAPKETEVLPGHSRDKSPKQASDKEAPTSEGVAGDTADLSLNKQGTGGQASGSETKPETGVPT